MTKKLDEDIVKALKRVGKAYTKAHPFKNVAANIATDIGVGAATAGAGAVAGQLNGLGAVPGALIAGTYALLSGISSWRDEYKKLKAMGEEVEKEDFTDEELAQELLDNGITEEEIIAIANQELDEALLGVITPKISKLSTPKINIIKSSINSIKQKNSGNGLKMPKLNTPKLKVEDVSTLLDAAIDNNPADMTTIFDSIIKERLSNLVDQRKANIAYSIFNSVQESEGVEGEIIKIDEEYEAVTNFLAEATDEEWNNLSEEELDLIEDKMIQALAIWKRNKPKEERVKELAKKVDRHVELSNKKYYAMSSAASKEYTAAIKPIDSKYSDWASENPQTGVKIKGVMWGLHRTPDNEDGSWKQMSRKEASTLMVAGSAYDKASKKAGVYASRATRWSGAQDQLNTDPDNPYTSDRRRGEPKNWPKHDDRVGGMHKYLGANKGASRGEYTGARAGMFLGGIGARMNAQLADNRKRRSFKGKIKNFLGLEDVQIDSSDFSDYITTLNEEDYNILVDEINQLDEISKEKLVKYVNKAVGSLEDHSSKAGRYDQIASDNADEYDNYDKEADKKSQKHFNKAGNRAKGIVQAADRLADPIYGKSRPKSMSGVDFEFEKGKK